MVLPEHLVFPESESAEDPKIRGYGNLGSGYECSPDHTVPWGGVTPQWR